MLPVLNKHFGNPSSTTHSYGWYTEELVQIAREQIASAINANPEEIVFTSGATESNNLAILGALTTAHPAKIISVVTEHRAVLDPLAHLHATEHEVVLMKVNSNGLLESQTLEKALCPKTKLVSIMLANNEIGVVQNIKQLAKVVRSFSPEIIFHCDASQAFGKIPVDVKDLDVDLLSLSAHKVYGPKGIGALYVNKRIQLQPLMFGGGHEGGIRPGTVNVPAIVGFGVAAKLAVAEMESDSLRMRELSNHLLTKLQNSLDGIAVNGCIQSRIPGNLNLRVDGVSNVSLLAEMQSTVAFSLTSACTSASKEPSYVLKALNLSREQQLSSLRLGIGRFNNLDEVETVGERFIAAIRTLR